MEEITTKQYRKTSRWLLMIPLALFAAVVLGISLSLLPNQTPLVSIVNLICLMTTFLEPLPALAFSVAGLCVAIRAKKNGEPKTKRLIALAIAEIAVCAGWLGLTAYSLVAASGV